jgi:hypothetical protein
MEQIGHTFGHHAVVQQGASMHSTVNIKLTQISTKTSGFF